MRGSTRSLRCLVARLYLGFTTPMAVVRCLGKGPFNEPPGKDGHKRHRGCCDVSYSHISQPRLINL
jgi:hypothetical protein